MKEFLKGAAVIIGVIAAVVFAIGFIQSTKWWQESEKADAEQERRDRTPHVIRETDGCKVYAFKEGEKYHFFTKCPNATVTTDRQFDVKCGKSCTRTETETIVTESRK